MEFTEEQIREIAREEALKVAKSMRLATTATGGYMPSTGLRWVPETHMCLVTQEEAVAMMEYGKFQSRFSEQLKEAAFGTTKSDNPVD